ncbi:MAG: class I SAM-dependent methyltransferase [Bryobacteraceae bacterium]|jgi:SAM-dependent methyltransferase
MPPYLTRLFDYVRERHPRSFRGIEEARAVSPERFDAFAEMFLAWLVAARGENAIAATADAFVRFTTDVNMAQARYEADGRYAHSSFAEVYADHYSQNETMADYLWGIYLTNFLWAHHVQIAIFFRDCFLTGLSAESQLVEIAPGHGGWGAWALSVLPEARLTGFDISPSSIEIAGSICCAAGLEKRATYEVRNVLDLQDGLSASADGLICSFLVEHLERPEQLFAVIQRILKPQGLGFVTAALTAAQVDHIYEFRFESELVRLCEGNGLRVLSTLSAGPKRLLPRARFLPRSMGLVVQKRTHDTF